jgi:Tat protein secretion system quality control protein TatD with DNase activity
MLGTDAPYLIPYSMGKPFPRFNEPAFLTHVLSLAAKAYKVSSSELAQVLHKVNFYRKILIL